MSKKYDNVNDHCRSCTFVSSKTIMIYYVLRGTLNVECHIYRTPALNGLNKPYFFDLFFCRFIILQKKVIKMVLCAFFGLLFL